MEIVIGIIVVLVLFGLLSGGSKKKEPSLKNKLDGAIIHAHLNGKRENIQVDADLYELREFCKDFPEFMDGQDGAFSLISYTSKLGYGPYYITVVNDYSSRGKSALYLKDEDEWRANRA